MERTLDFSQSIDVPAFDAVVQAMSSNSVDAIKRAEDVLAQFRNHPNALSCVHDLLLQSNSQYTKFFALQVLDEIIMTRWLTFSDAEQKEIRGFVVQLIVNECSSKERVRAQRALLNKMNTTLVSIAKRDWPQKWPTFIQEVCGSAGPNEPLTENNLSLMRIVGEEVFEFGEKTMTSMWIAKKKEAFKADFACVISLCLETLNCDDPVVQHTSLLALEKFISWSPPELVMNERLLQFLCNDVCGNLLVRSPSVRCLTELCLAQRSAGAAGDDQKNLLERAFRAVVSTIVENLPTTHSSLDDRIVALYNVGNNQDRQFVNDVNQLLIAFLRNYLSLIAYDDILLVSAHQLLVGMSRIDHGDMFKSCVEYWFFLGDMFVRSSNPSVVQKKLGKVLSGARYALIKNMAKPEEIIIVEEDGELRREHIADVEVLQMYQLMRDTLILLTRVDPQDTMNTFQALMSKLVDGSEWSWQNCNTLSWAVGAVSAALRQEDESVLFSSIVVNLLTMCAAANSLEDRALIASNIMFIVGQYPRFLRNHPRFLKVSVQKVFEFMQQTFPGVQQMAVDTLLKVTKQVSEKLVEPSSNEPSFAMTVAQEWPKLISMLSVDLAQASYGAAGHMVNACPRNGQEALLMTFLASTTESFKALTNRAAAQGGDVAYADEAYMAELLHYLRIFSNIASTCGTSFIHEMNLIIWDLHGYYRTCGETQQRLISAGASMSGNTDTRNLSHADLRTLKGLRLAKREILKIFENFVLHTKELKFVADKCMPDIFEVVLLEYESSPVETKEAGALALITACVNKLKTLLDVSCGAILDHTFNPTISIISHNMEDFPEFRVNLFKLIQALADQCFPAFVQYVAQNSSVIDGMLWAIKHTEFSMMKTGLETLDSFLQRVMSSEFAESFITAYIQPIFREVMVCAMDTLHASGFLYQCHVLMKLFAISEKCDPTAPVVGRLAVTAYLHESLMVLPKLTPTLITAFIDRCFSTCRDQKAFNTSFADFLIEVQIWGAEQEHMLLQQENGQQRSFTEMDERMLEEKMEHLTTF